VTAEQSESHSRGTQTERRESESDRRERESELRHSPTCKLQRALHRVPVFIHKVEADKKSFILKGKACEKKSL